MPKVTFRLPDGNERAVDARPGDSVMETAVRHEIGGIVAECGGHCSCATCHVYVDPPFVDAVGGPGDIEEDLLEYGVTERRPGSRLSCQIALTDELDGLTVEIPAVQP